jgi:hypothetical protein
MSKLELERMDDGTYNISGIIYSEEEAATIRNFIEVEEMNDHIHEHGHDAYREKYNGEEP